jgi:hypothetical protein
LRSAPTAIDSPPGNTTDVGALLKRDFFSECPASQNLSDTGKKKADNLSPFIFLVLTGTDATHAPEGTGEV